MNIILSIENGHDLELKEFHLRSQKNLQRDTSGADGIEYNRCITSRQARCLFIFRVIKNHTYL